MDRLLTRAQEARARLEHQPRPPGPTAAAVAALSLDAFVTAGLAVQVSVAWWPTSLWFVGTAASAAALAAEGYPRATIWTAHELLNVLQVAPDRATLHTLATAKHLFDGDLSLSSLASHSDTYSLLSLLSHAREESRRRRGERS
jgi:hypothetical protein